MRITEGHFQFTWFLFSADQMPQSCQEDHDVQDFENHRGEVERAAIDDGRVAK